MSERAIYALMMSSGTEYEIEAAESGEEALEILEELRQEGIEVAVIVTDQIMQELKGMNY